MAYVEIRLRMLLMTIVGPLLLLMVAIRYSHWMEQLSTGQTVAAASTVVLTVMCLFPWLVTRMWKMGRIEDRQLNRKLMMICEQANIGVRQIKIWKTGYQMANAAVTGLLPGTRVILLSDLLLKQFEPEEVEAIVRHEAGHVRLNHLPLKMMFIVVPMLVLLIDKASDAGITGRLGEMLSASGSAVSGEHAAHVMAIGFAFYLLVMLRWLSHKMEFEADLFAATDLDNAGTNVHVDQTRAALWRLAALSPEQFKKRTLMHPSIKDRILFIEKVASEPELASLYRSAFSRRKRIVMALWGLVLMCSLVLVG
jgi:Zn-dependent protease with chaperone function